MTLKGRHKMSQETAVTSCCNQKSCGLRFRTDWQVVFPIREDYL